MILLIECIIGIIIFTAIVIPIALKNPIFIVGDYPPEIVKKCMELKIFVCALVGLLVVIF